MKRFSPREFLFLCAPILLVGAGFIAVRLLHPPRDPDAVIALRVTRDPNPRRAWGSAQPTFDFEWKARAQGGPSEQVQLLYTQKLVALGNGDGRSQVIFQDPASPATPNANNINSGGGGSFSRDFTEASQNLSIPYEALPLWTKRVEWRGDFVAAPLQSNSGSVVATGLPATFTMLARIKGAARATKTFPVAFDARQINPIQSLALQTVNPSNAAKGADICVTTRFRDQQRRVHARLVAVNGGKNRLLWHKPETSDGTYLVNSEDSGYSSIWINSRLFKLRDVPAQWGEIVYIVDAVYNPDAANLNVAGDTRDCDAAEIERLKRAGWLHFSRRITVRKAGATIKPVIYPQTPNTQFLDAKTSVSKTDWIITARLRYNGPKLKPGEELDSQGPEWIEANGKYSDIDRSGSTYGIRKGTKPDEYLATITVPLKALGQPRPITMKMDIADTHAAPLHFQTKLQIPGAPK